MPRNPLYVPLGFDTRPSPVRRSIAMLASSPSQPAPPHWAHRPHDGGHAGRVCDLGRLTITHAP